MKGKYFIAQCPVLNKSWVQTDKKITNPFNDKSMLGCGIILRDLYGIFGNWSLALAAYNAGEHRTLRVILKTGLRNFWSIAERHRLPAETLNYVAAALAVMAIVESPAPAEASYLIKGSEVK